MHVDVQKANIWKRISAGLLDLILLSVIVTLLATALSSVLGFDRYNTAMDDCYAKYEAQFGISFDITLEEFNAMSEEEVDLYQQAYAVFSSDPDVIYNFNMIICLTIVIASISILAGYLALELAVPLFLKDGRTLGKKVFGIGLMRTGGIRINTVSLFIRTVLGKFSIETMIPVLVIMMVFWGTIGIVGPLILIALILGQLISAAVSPTNALLHDRLANTVVVDMESQMIFDSEDALIEYTKRLHAEKASKQVY